MSNTITIPVLDYKMDKARAIVFAAIIVVVILILTTNFGDLIKKALSGLGTTAGGLVSGGITGAAAALGAPSATTSQTQMLGSATTATNYANSVMNNASGSYVTNSGPFSQSLYQSNSAASNLTLPQLQSIVGAIWSGLGSSFLGLPTGAGDGQVVYNAFQPCQSQTDVSNVAVEYFNEYGDDLLYDMCFKTDNIMNLSPASDGQANEVWLAKIIAWAQNLPTT